jgi:DNA helicase-2/ATP-dependent DNA helicase PcrA
VLLLTLHNAKGLEFPIVFIAGLEDGLFPHSRSLNAASTLEEERRLCYVGMTRARKRLYLTWARSRRRFGGGELEPCTPSRFLREVPERLTENLSPDTRARQVDLTGERWQVREAARRNTFTGKTYNSLENIAQFFSRAGSCRAARRGPRLAAGFRLRRRQRLRRRFSKKSAVWAWRRGSASALWARDDFEAGRRGDDTKITVTFPGYGLKKLIAKFAGIQTEE